MTALQGQPNVVLIGYRGSGKTTVGALLAGKLSWLLVDTDELVASEANCSIADVFVLEGESGFRRREAEVIARVTGARRTVISVGGGAVENAENVTRLRTGGRVVWLAAPAEVLHKRIAADSSSASTRPKLTSKDGIDEVIAMLAKREPLYRSSADFTVQTEARSAEAVASQIAEWLEV